MILIDKMMVFNRENMVKCFISESRNKKKLTFLACKILTINY